MVNIKVGFMRILIMRFKKFIQETISSDVALYTPYNYSSQNIVSHDKYTEFPDFCHIDQWNFDKKDVVGRKKKSKLLGK